MGVQEWLVTEVASFLVVVPVLLYFPLEAGQAYTCWVDLMVLAVSPK